MGKNIKSVLFLIPTLGGGGAERVLVNLVNGMDKSKYDITLQSIFKSGVNTQFIDNGIKHRQGFIKQFKGSTYLLKLLSPRILYKFIVGSGYDIVVSYLEGPSARIVSGCKDPHVKTVGWIHCVHKNAGEVYHSFRSEKEAETCYHAFDAIVYVSQKVKAEFLRYFPSLKRNEVIHNTNDDARIHAMANDEVIDVSFSNNVKVVSVGRLIPVKGYERLIQAHTRLIKEGIIHHIYIIGSGNLESDFEQQIRENGVEETFHLVGFRDNPYKYVNKADIFVCSSYSEGYSTAVSEALILGKPVVSTEVGGAKEMLGENNEFGLVVENSTEGIYEGLKQLITDKQILAFFTQQAKVRGACFSKANAVKEVEELLDSL